MVNINVSDSTCRLISEITGKIYDHKAVILVGISVAVELRQGGIGITALHPPIELREGSFKENHWIKILAERGELESLKVSDHC